MHDTRWWRETFLPTFLEISLFFIRVKRDATKFRYHKFRVRFPLSSKQTNIQQRFVLRLIDYSTKIRRLISWTLVSLTLEPCSCFVGAICGSYMRYVEILVRLRFNDFLAVENPRLNGLSHILILETNHSSRWLSSFAFVCGWLWSHERCVHFRGAVAENAAGWAGIFKALACGHLHRELIRTFENHAISYHRMGHEDFLELSSVGCCLCQNTAPSELAEMILARR